MAASERLVARGVKLPIFAGQGMTVSRVNGVLRSQSCHQLMRCCPLLFCVFLGLGRKVMLRLEQLSDLIPLRQSPQAAVPSSQPGISHMPPCMPLHGYSPLKGLVADPDRAPYLSKPRRTPQLGHP